MPPVVLLGPQRDTPTLGDVLGDLGMRGPFGVITAGWLDREGEDDELRDAAGGRAKNLEIYARLESVMASDAALHAALRTFRERQRELRDLYRIRLAALAGAVERLDGISGDDGLLGPERDDAVEAVRRLDMHQLERVAAMDEEFWHGRGLATHHELCQAREALARDVADSEAVLIAGGHVGELCLRMWLLQIKPLLQGARVIAWSAGAMALGERIVLFHDSPPQGQGHSEVLRRGLGLFPEVLPLPHASDRLRLGDPARVAFLARRYAEHRPIALDAQARLDWQGAPGGWRVAPGTHMLCRDGQIRPWEPLGSGEPQ